MATKPKVLYRPGFADPVVGRAASVYTLDHPDQRLNHSIYGVTTSRVIRVEPSGEFETLNSIYVPARDPIEVGEEG